MTRRIIGLFIAPLLLMAGAWICYNWMAAHWVPQGKLIWMGPLLVVAGLMWLASDWLDL